MYMKYRLGLDIGANSIGWAVVKIGDATSTPLSLEAAGARIFSDGREVRSKSTLKSARTSARSARRRRDRYKQRRTYLLALLREHNLFPQDQALAKELQIVDPLMLRSKGVNDRLSLHELGRSIIHLNQRRGFKSNRKDPESRSGVVKDSIDALKLELSLAGVKTLGEFLWEYRKKKQPTRARRMGTKSADLYRFYPSRELLEDEFSQLWDYQSEHHSDVLTAELKERIRKIIFTQRPLKPARVGKCAYLPHVDRGLKALPSLQKYRVLQEVNNLEWATVNGVHKLIEIPQARDLVLELFLKPSTKDGKVTFNKIQKIVKGLGITEGQFKFNLQSDQRKFLEGDKTAAIMQRDDYFGSAWHAMSTEQQDHCINLILDATLDDHEVVSRLQQQYGLNHERANNVANADLPHGAGALSVEACTLLNDLLQTKYIIQPDAVQQAVKQHPLFNNPYKLACDHQLLEQLPYYGESVRGHIIPGNGTEIDYQSRIGMVSNPTVHIALNQIRHLVNELIKRFGPPSSIALELARDLPLGEKGLKALNKEMAVNTKRNEDARKELIEHGQRVTHDSLLRLKLWKELGSSPTDRRCIFSGELISIEELFNGKAEIEHIIPFSISLDDSFMNKTICKRRANRDKGQRSPFDAFGHSPIGYNWADIFARAQQLHKGKQWRFKENALEIWRRDHADFLARHLNDTRYIGRLTREYLANICRPNKIDVVTGRLTSLLRHHWGLNTVLDKGGDKNRNDHRHHAVDAIVVAMTNRATLQKVSRAAKQSEELDLNMLFPDGKKITPWAEFRDEVEQVVDRIVVSHKASRHTSGKLHNDTAYGIVDGPDAKGMCTVVVRKDIEKLTTLKQIQSIRDPYLRNQLLNTPLESLQSVLQSKGIRTLRCTERMSVIPINDSNGRPYKAYKGDSNWASEIYQMPDKAGKWKDVVVSMFEANQSAVGAANKRKPHPAAKLLMRLHRNDYLKLRGDGQGYQIWKVQNLSKGIITLCRPEESNTDTRNRDKENPFSYVYKSASSLKEAGAKLVHVSPSGLVSK